MLYKDPLTTLCVTDYITCGSFCNVKTTCMANTTDVTSSQTNFDSSLLLNRSTRRIFGQKHAMSHPTLRLERVVGLSKGAYSGTCYPID